MKKLNFYLAILTLLSGCANARTSDNNDALATLPAPKSDEKVATFAGGCFWSLSEAFYELRGVNKVVVGYAGGTIKNPTYEDVCTKLTGHAESVQVYYNPSIITYSTLTEAFFCAHDPTTVDRQGPDEGPDYRSVAFYRSPEEKKVLEKMIEQINHSGHYSDPVVTKVAPFTVLYPAENYHQGYFRLHGNDPYIQQVSLPKVLKLRTAMTDKLKPEFQYKAGI